MLFKNPHFSNEITVDIDSYFFYFVRPKSEQPSDEKQGITLDFIKQRLKIMNEILSENAPRYVFYRRSSNDHAHVKLVFYDDVTVLDGFMIRAFLMDDQTRLSLDLARYLKTADLHEMNRCFDEKATVSGVKKSGPWIHISVDRENYAGAILEDYTAYLPRWEIEYQNILKEQENQTRRAKLLAWAEYHYPKDKADQSEQEKLGFL